MEKSDIRVIIVTPSTKEAFERVTAEIIKQSDPDIRVTQDYVIRKLIAIADEAAKAYEASDEK